MSNTRLEKFIQKLWKKDKKEAFEHIKNCYFDQWFAIVNYVYWWNITNRKLLEDWNIQSQEYFDFLMNSCILLPDGIALQLFVFAYFLFLQKKLFWIQNLNWTDFLQVLLDWFKDYNLYLILYWTKKEQIKQNAKFFESKWYNVLYYQDWYSEFNWDEFQKKLNWLKKKSGSGYFVSRSVFLFIQWRSTVDNPIQELRTLHNLDKIKKYNFLVVNSGWLFDFDQRWWKEKRAPKIVRKFRLERLWKALLNPQKSWLKKIIWSLQIFVLIFKKIILKK